MKTNIVSSVEVELFKRNMGEFSLNFKVISYDKMANYEKLHHNFNYYDDKGEMRNCQFRTDYLFNLSPPYINRFKEQVDIRDIPIKNDVEIPFNMERKESEIKLEKGLVAELKRKNIAY